MQMFSGGGLLAGKGPAGPKGHRAYAVGDIHGRLDLLDDLLAKIEADVAARPAAETSIIFLGDLIDRGPDSAQVVERLRTYRPDFGRALFLMGNHEEVMLRVLGGDTALLADWLRFGGAECVRSYGVDPEMLPRNPREAVRTLKRSIPPAHVQFVSSFADTASFGSYVFVHAGIRPGVALAEQALQDLRWVRQPFLEDGRDHGFVVVHGHTIAPEVDERPNRIGIDTGAYRTGVLTALGIEGADRWYLATGGAAEAGRSGAEAPATVG